MPKLKNSTSQLLQSALGLEKYPLAQLISMFEREDNDSLKLRANIQYELKELKISPKGFIVGWTGSPGAGKSSLLAKLSQNILDNHSEISIAILAVDPSSHVSGGSLLGDRTRTRFLPAEKRVFFRSQASELELGGLGRATYPVCTLLTYFFDIIFIETVGVGQSEIEIRKLADTTALVLQPFAGDQIQFIKSGIMEIPNMFIVSKCDEEKLAKKSYHQLQASLEFMSGLDSLAAADITLTSAMTGKGIDELANKIIKQLRIKQSANAETIRRRERYFLEKTVMRAYGEFGLAVLKICYREYADFEENLSLFHAEIREHIREVTV